MAALNEQALVQLFTEAHTYHAWQDKTVSDEILLRLYDLVRYAPTAANAGPARFVFVRSAQAKARLKPTLSEGNQLKTMAAPVTVIVAHDTQFYEHLPLLFPHVDAKSWFVGNQAAIDATAFRNSSLQGGYLILAARALGLDCGPMSGFDQAKVDEIFFQDGRFRSNFLINLGYGAPGGMHERNPRLSFDMACRIE